MRNDSPDDESSSTNETLMAQQTAELLEEFEKIEEEYENYTTAGSDDRERGDTDVEPAVTLQANMLNGETTSLEVMDMESVVNLMYMCKIIEGVTFRRNGTEFKLP